MGKSASTPVSHITKGGVKSRLYEELFPGRDNLVNRTYNVFMMGLISSCVLAVILETEQSLKIQYQSFFNTFELVSIMIFTIEYLIRLWVCTEDPRYPTAIKGRLRYALEPLSLIDLLSFLPFYLPFMAIDLRLIRAFRLFRLFRIFKLGRYSESLTALSNVVRKKKEELIVTLFSGLILLIMASSLMYLVEHEAQPESFSSIPAAMWWGVITLTTVGYGDIFPVTIIGKLLGAAIALMGVGLFALPAGIIASGFASEIQKKTPTIELCPHCGKNVHELPLKEG